MRQKDCIPGDTFQCLGLDALGRAIGNGEWTGKPREALEYSHTEGLAYGQWVARMNPPYSMLYPLTDCDWSRVHIYRLCLRDMNPGCLPDYPGTDPNFQRIFLKNITAHLGECYDYARIGRFGVLSTIAHWGGPIGQWYARQELSKPIPQPVDGSGKPVDVCSTWWTDRLEDSIKECYGLPSFDLIPGIPRENRRPADIPLSPWLVRMP